MGEAQEFSLLFDISQTLDSSLDLRDTLGPVLEILARYKGLLRGSLTLLNRETGELSIEAAHGLSPSQQRRGRYKVGEGIIGQVFQTGKPAVIPKVSQEPRYLNRTGAVQRVDGRDISYISVPIKLENQVIGALSVDREYREGLDFDKDLRFLTIISGLIAQSVTRILAVNEEKKRLERENSTNCLSDTYLNDFILIFVRESLWALSKNSAMSWDQEKATAMRVASGRRHASGRNRSARTTSCGP